MLGWQGAGASLLDERLKDLGVTQARWFTMVCLQRGGGGLTQRELAHLMTIENPTLVRLLDSLEEQGMEAILCAAVHGIFAEASDQYLLAAGLQSLVTTNTRLTIVYIGTVIQSFGTFNSFMTGVGRKLEVCVLIRLEYVCLYSALGSP